ncbi:LOW QUALITY PROTEIN: hypothetical protein HJC23_003567, partial [Cyclotella cryptica]
GCFWQVKHQFAQAERRILSRSDDQLLSRAGYTSGKSSVSGKVGYHSASNIAGYVSLRHTEVVSLRMPPRSVGKFACDRINFETGMGSIGILWVFPGGSIRCMRNCWWRPTGDELDFAVGKGVSFLWNRGSFHFLWRAISSMQFHDGIEGIEDYPQSHNSLASKFPKIVDFGFCPNGLVGIGIGGL